MYPILQCGADVPSIRSVWPPSSSVHEDGGAGKTGVRSGKRRRTSCCQRDGPGHGAAPDPRDGRCLEIVGDGLPSFGGAQFTVDTTLVLALHCDGCSSSTTQGEDLSRIGRSSSTGSVGLVGG